MQSASAAASVPTAQRPADGASFNHSDIEALWNQLLPGKYSILIPMFRQDRNPRDFREVVKEIPKVIDFLEAWDNVPQNKQPNWYRDALANYSLPDRLHWIFFHHGEPKAWMSPLLDVSDQVIFAEQAVTPAARPCESPQQSFVPQYINQEQTSTTSSAGLNYIQQCPNDQGAAPAASEAAATSSPWQSYSQSNPPAQDQTDPAASAWPRSTGWQLNSGPQTWSAQS
eukprot:82415-Amphidinium_carterae.1